MPMRIACYGYAEPAAGSVSSAGFLILEEMLRRGHEIDFFGKRCFAYPAGLERFPNFRYVQVEGRAERAFGHAAGKGPGLWRAALGAMTAGQTERNIPRAMAKEHAHRHYAVQLFLGTWAFGRVRGLPSISWVQGPPGTDSRSIGRHREQLIRCDGWRRYASLRAFAAYRSTIGVPPFRHSDVVICGSQWSMRMLRPYLAAHVVLDRLPYPVDLREFQPDTAHESAASAATPEILWLGRSVPRKRLDLFLGACERLIAGGRRVKVRGVGGFGFAPGYQQLVRAFRYPERLQWTTGIPRAEVPALLRRASVLVQPSEEENFGSSIAEALACGTPVVCGPTNGTGDYIGDAGAKFPTYDAQAVAAAIATVLDGVAADRQGWRKRSRAAAEAAFEVGRVVGNLERILQNAARPHARPDAAAPADPVHTQPAPDSIAEPATAQEATGS